MVPSESSGNGRPDTVPSMSVALDRRLTRLMPGRSTSPARVKTPRALSRSTRTRSSALDNTAPTGASAGPCVGRLARSTRRLYSVNDNVTLRDGSLRDVSPGRVGVCADGEAVSIANMRMQQERLSRASVEIIRVINRLRSVTHAFDEQVDGRRLGLGGEFGCEEDGRPERGEYDVHRQGSDDGPSTGLSPELVGEREQA